MPVSDACPSAPHAILPINKRASQLAVFFNITATSVQAAAAVLLLVPVALLAGRHDYLASFTAGQLHGLAATAVRMYNYGYTTALVFFGAYDLVIGFLALRSGFIPRPIGILMVVTGFGWLTYLLPNVAAHLLPVNLVAGLLGELAMILWLLLKGVSEDQWLMAMQSWRFRRQTIEHAIVRN